MKIAFVIRRDCIRCANIVKRIIEIFPPEWEVEFDTDTAELVGKPGKEIGEISADIIITIGGDGTALRALQMTKGPILGINMGGLGFLTEIEIGEIERSIYQIIRGEYKITDSMKIDVMLNGIKQAECTNEAVIYTGKVAKLRKFNVYVGKNFIEGTGADGVIVATPMGSTSYSFSAGGPILLPALNAMVISYLAPFGSRTRPLIVPSGETIAVKQIGKEQDGILILDGQIQVPLNHGDIVEISVSKNRAKFISLKGTFYEKLREKLIKLVVN
ncbi:MAG: NAD(+) kinase [Thermoplasmatales archaeon B_DKE]|nr:MAG: NAD(+) kinase [Thermoplasmatales archaeon B_DKE]